MSLILHQRRKGSDTLTKRGDWCITKILANGFVVGYTLYKSKPNGLTGYLYIHLGFWVISICLGRK